LTRDRRNRIGLEVVYAIITFGFGPHQAGLFESGQVMRNRRWPQIKQSGQLLSCVRVLRKQTDDLEAVVVGYSLEGSQQTRFGGQSVQIDLY
jgi:hypothetical protein